ncbi:hypothetical protein [Phytohabitans houttuyneae]|uniref:hypothetical protein n=1 Tax=Phytohabitans houttuyneae TaxID=1076126 RepID=UPI00156306DF|nr:hypothetical protein [Phytohabitans houttuyneae]
MSSPFPHRPEYSVVHQVQQSQGASPSSQSKEAASPALKRLATIGVFVAATSFVAAPTVATFATNAPTAATALAGADALALVGGGLLTAELARRYALHSAARPKTLPSPAAAELEDALRKWIPDLLTSPLYGPETQLWLHKLLREHPHRAASAMRKMDKTTVRRALRELDEVDPVAARLLRMARSYSGRLLMLVSDELVRVSQLLRGAAESLGRDK